MGWQGSRGRVKGVKWVERGPFSSLQNRKAALCWGWHLGVHGRAGLHKTEVGKEFGDKVRGTAEDGRKE